jgi:diguanylate cyclase (GGDEF)-like protein
VATESDSLFSFVDSMGSDENGFANGENALTTVVSLERADMCRTLEAAAQASYHWSIASDVITWSANVENVLGCKVESISTGRRFANLLDGNNFTSRYDTVMRGKEKDAGSGVGFEIEYQLKPKGRQAETSAWIEDVGRWFADATGSPSDVYGVMRLSDARHNRDQEMSYLSSCDPLTGMMNRSRMGDALKDAINVATTEKTPCAFAILAVNNLDVMNEAYGYEVADEVIIELGQRLRKVMRVGDAIARYSGSKFGIILNGCKPDELQNALERFMRAVRDSVIETKLGPVWALLSIGAVSLPALGDDVQTAIAHAEEALSEAFRHPGDSKVVYTSSEVRKNRRALNARCATEIVACLRNNLFKLAFQPICDARTGDVIMHEALLRMADSTGAMITAAHLVPIAEQLGLVRLIDRAVLQLALHTLETYPDSKLSVNVSATTANDPRWNAQLLEMIAAVPELACRLVMEVTETTALGDVNALRDFMQGVRATGCGIALDDFGAGYTSYRNIKELPLSHIKLDGTYCQSLAGSSTNRMFVESLVKIANAFDLKIIAEWVETESDAHILRDLGVHFLQGHYWGEPSVVAPWARVQNLNFELSPTISEVQHNEHVEEFAGVADEVAPEPEMAEAEEPTDQPEVQENVIAELEPPSLESDALESDAASPEGFDWSEPEEGLSKLKDALAELNAAFGTGANDTMTADEQRLAS